LKSKKVAELREIAKAMLIKGASSLKKADLLEAIIAAAAEGSDAASEKADVSEPTEKHAEKNISLEKRIKFLEEEIEDISQELYVMVEKLEDFRQKQILIYVFIHGYNTKKAAEKMELSDSYVRQLRRDFIDYLFPSKNNRK